MNRFARATLTTAVLIIGLAVAAGQVSADQPGLSVTVHSTAQNPFPSETCWGETYDIYVSGVTGNLLTDCWGEDLIALSIAIWEEDAIGDDRVREIWLYFPTNGQTSSIPFEYTFEDVHLADECVEWDYRGEFYIEVKGPCLAALLRMPQSDTYNTDLIFYPGPPTHVAPADGATGQPLPVAIDWYGVYNANSYKLQVDDEISFASPEIDVITGTSAYSASGLAPGTAYYWRVRAYNNTCGWGNWSDAWSFTTEPSTDVVSVESPQSPEKFNLNQNYPNPFNLSTRIEFALPKASFVTIEVFNVSGQKIKTLVSEQLSAGYKVATWDGTNESGSEVASGVYIYRIAAGEFEASRKMILLK